MPTSSSSGLAADFEHPALEAAPRAVSLDSGRLNDRQRVSVLLQAAGLSSLVSRAGWHLQGWSTARVSAEGRLFVAADGALPGRSARTAQALLSEMVARLFGEGPIAGRGEARGAARRLVDAWGLLLSPLSTDDLVTQILEAAPFLWEAPFAAARSALAGSFRFAGSVSEGPARLWVAGPSFFRRRVLACCGSLAALHDQLAGEGARGLWNREGDGTPEELVASGRFRAAIAAWEGRATLGDRDRLEWARACLALGRYEAGLSVLAGLQGAGALALAARFQLHLGELGGARATLKRLPRSALDGGQWVEVADVAARVFANRGEPARAEPWVRSALAAARGGGRTLVRAQLVAAGAAWDRGDLEAMDSWLDAARPALAEPDLAWRWHQARGWRAMAEGNGAAVEPMAQALRLGRRFQTRPEAAGLWNELGLARALHGDLAGADRAFVHAVKLEMGCDGPRKTTLALYNLAEIRLRRGRLKGVAEILARSEAENRSAGNLRGQTQDAELWARLELAQGRPEAALEICGAALVALERRGLEWRRAELRLLGARALGWLGRRDEAKGQLEGLEARVLSELEPEERPALFALAGLVAEASAQARGTEWEALFAALLAQEAPTTHAWAPLSGLEPFRAARLVFDVEILRPGSVPPDLRRRAIEALKGVGATRLALLLERRDAGLWSALADFWEGSNEGMEGIAALLSAAGYPEARAVWMDRLHGGRETVLIEGAGGPAVIERELARGRLRLSAAQAGEALAALATLAARHLDSAASVPEMRAEPPPAAGGEKLIGESLELRSALQRISRLAPADMPILILGESGTGKELAARQIHRLSRRAAAAFLAVNRAALSETLLLSDLFGHSRGAFTGADRERKGVFEAAHGGTVFLDEIGDLPLAAQGLLLRVLQEGEIRRLGESTARRVDVRVLAATHRGLERMVDEGTFRRDLYFRLKVGSVSLPPLRDRGSDVLLIGERLLAEMRLPAPVRLSQAARLSLVAHRWPGNVRELENVLAVAAALTENGVIGPEHLELPSRDSVSRSSYHQQVEALRRRLVESALEETEGNAAEAARKLGISRQALSYLIKQLGIPAAGRGTLR